VQEEDDREMNEMIDMLGLRKPKHLVRLPAFAAGKRDATAHASPCAAGVNRL
jgi:hypothetical protein